MLVSLIKLRDDLICLLQNTISSHITNQFYMMYDDCKKIPADNTLDAFNQCLSYSSNWKKNQMTKIINELMTNSNSVDWLFPLCKHIILLNYLIYSMNFNLKDHIKTISAIDQHTFYIRLYSLIASNIINQSFLLDHNVSEIQYKKNAVLVHEIVKEDIKKVFNYFIPMSTLTNDFTTHLSNYIKNTDNNLFKKVRDVELDNINIKNQLDKIDKQAATLYGGNVPDHIKSFDLHTNDIEETKPQLELIKSEKPDEPNMDENEPVVEKQDIDEPKIEETKEAEPDDTETYFQAGKSEYKNVEIFSNTNNTKQINLDFISQKDRSLLNM